MNKNLALFGGKKNITQEFRKYNSLGVEEEKAVAEVMQTGVLSKYIGAWHEDWCGGPKVKEFERRCEDFFQVKHAVTVNSWTSGLTAAIGAIGIQPGDEVIVTPWTMSASATAILHWNAIPVFADIDPQTYNLDPDSIRNNITKYTKAIMVADIFGLSADMEKINDIAKEFNLKVISDTAQAPGALYKNHMAGTMADIGGFSLNYHKHIHTGEGGILITNNDDYADRLRLIRNHAEVVVADKNFGSLDNMIGHNFRLGEIESAIGIEQLKKLNNLVESRQALAEKLNRGLSSLEGLITPFIPHDQTSTFYVYPLQIDPKKITISRDLICEALNAEGFSIANRYQNIHLLPIYQKKIAYGTNGFPWTSDICKREVSYKKGICPTAEKLNDELYMGFGLCNFDWTLDDIDLIVETFIKVWNNFDEFDSYTQR